MALMEFLSKNLLNTTTMLTVDSGTATMAYLFDRNISLGYSTYGYNSTTATVLSIVFDETTPVSHILLQNHNLKKFSVFYDSTTANSIQAFTTNSQTSNYISFSTISAKSIQIQVEDTIAGSVEKSIGELVISDRELSFTRNPTAKLFKPVIDRTQVRHVMPDGGITLFNIKDKYKAKIGLRYITDSFYDSLLDLYEEANPLYFVPFPTSTGWDGKAYQCVWPGKWDFSYSANVKESGYSGNIVIEETTSG